MKNKRRRRPSCRPFKLFRLFGLFTRNFSTQNHPLRNFLLSFFLSFFLSLVLYFSNLVFLSILFLTFSHSYFIPFLSPYWLPISVILVHPTNPSLFKVLFSSRKASAVIVIELSCQHNGLRSRPTILQPVGSNPSTGTKVPEVAQLCVTFTRCKLQ